MTITNLSIQNYRGIARADLTGLRQFSVVTGANNAGKTTVLEAMALLKAMNQPMGTQALPIIGAISGHRQVRGDARRSMRLDRATAAYIKGDNGYVEILAPPENEAELFVTSGAWSLKLESQPDPIMFARSNAVCFVAAPTSPNADALEHLWSLAVKDGYSNEVLEASKRLDPSIVSLQLILEGPNTILYAESDMGLPRRSVWPVAVGGSGFKRLLSLVAQLSGATGLICIDDPDAFLHPKMFEQVATLLWGLVRNGAQVVVATHSLELIDTFAKDINGSPESEQFGVFGFSRDANGVLTCTLRMPGQSAQAPRRRDDIRQLLGLS